MPVNHALLFLQSIAQSADGSNISCRVFIKFCPQLADADHNIIVCNHISVTPSLFIDLLFGKHFSRMLHK